MTRRHQDISRSRPQAPFLSHIIFGGGILLLILTITVLIATI